MKDLLTRRSVLRQNWIFILFLSLCLYFSYHLVQGERSYVRLIGLKQAIAREEDHYRELVAERESIEKKVSMLRPGSVNRDYLEERARAMLGYRAPEEMDVIIRK